MVIKYDKEMVKAIKKQDEVICLDPKAHLVACHVALQLSLKGKHAAKIVKGYK